MQTRKLQDPGSECPQLRAGSAVQFQILDPFPLSGKMPPYSEGSVRESLWGSEERERGLDEVSPEAPGDLI